jgi:hypothetical protein
MRCVVILLQADGFCVHSVPATRLHGARFARNFTLPKDTLPAAERFIPHSLRDLEAGEKALTRLCSFA